MLREWDKHKNPSYMAGFQGGGEKFHLLRLIKKGYEVLLSLEAVDEYAILFA